MNVGEGKSYNTSVFKVKCIREMTRKPKRKLTVQDLMILYVLITKRRQEGADEDEGKKML